jgi:hypothetical protein
MKRLTWILLALAACASETIVDEPPPPDEVDELPPGECAPPAGRLTIYAIPPPVPLDWSTPNNLLRTVQASRTAGAELVEQGAIVMGRSIGHVNLELDCGEHSIPLTGQTNVDGNDLQAVTDGAGLLLRDTATGSTTCPRPAIARPRSRTSPRARRRAWSRGSRSRSTSRCAGA